MKCLSLLSYLSSAILANRGSSQPSVHSQCESKKVKTFPLASSAPLIRARMSPDLSGSLSVITGTGSFAT